ncbi:chromate transporter [Prevotella sp.]|uniref:chromate transporter n=1 Tax=Prevotella sp. TaxID=59823 RepID=UPI002F9228A0
MYITLFKTFFKIGIVTFGGGYAMIPMIKADVVDKHKWIKEEEFIDLLAIAQSCPGVFAINISIFIGYKLRKMKGALCTAIGTALPSFLIILAIAMFFHAFQENKVVAAMFAGIRPAVVALIAVPTFELAKSAKIGLANCWIPISSALLIWLLGVNPIYVIIAAGLGGYIYGRFLKSTE